MQLTRRSLNALGLIACALLLGYAFYVEYVDGIAPCPLCWFQRVVVILLGVVFLVGALHKAGPTGARVYAVLIAAVSVLGIAIALRHIYIQSQPEGTVESCGAPLKYMVQNFPLLETVGRVLAGSGECGEINWRFLGLTMPMWLLACFVGLGAAGFWRNWRAAPPSATP